MTNHEIKRRINETGALYQLDNEFLRNEANKRNRKIDMNDIYQKVGFLNELLDNNEVPKDVVIMLSE